MGRPAGSKTDDYIIGFMCGLMWGLEPPTGRARALARLTIKLGQVPRRASEFTRVDRLARKIRSHQFRRGTKEWRDGFLLGKWMYPNPQDPDPVPMLLECISLADLMKLAPKPIARRKFTASRRPK